MSHKPYIFIETHAGSAAMAYWLLGGKPPISYMGGKSGYAATIADILGLSQHHKPAGIILGEPGPFAAVHATLGGASGSAEEVAAMLLSVRWSFSEKGPEHGYGGPGCEVRTTKATWTTEARDACLSADNFSDRMGALPLPNTKAVANIIRSWKDEEPRALWERLKAKGWPSLLLPEGPRVQVKRADFRAFSPLFRPWPAPQTLVPVRGRWLGPQSLEDVAAHMVETSWRRSGFGGYMGPDRPSNHRDSDPDWVASITAEGIAGRSESLPTFPPLAVWQGFAEDLALPLDLSGVVIYADVPYAGTTKYKYGDCPRENVLRLARDWSARGAIVAISEAVRLDDALGAGWHAVQIDHARRGQKRTFSKQQSEWLTLNRPPVHVPGKQIGMFG